MYTALLNTLISMEGKSETVCVRETGWRRGNTQFVMLRAEMLKSAKTFCFRRVLLLSLHIPSETAERDSGEL